MKPEVERCGEEAVLCSAVRLDGVKEEEDVVIAGVRCQEARCLCGSVELRKA